MTQTIYNAKSTNQGKILYFQPPVALNVENSTKLRMESV